MYVNHVLNTTYTYMYYTCTTCIFYYPGVHYQTAAGTGKYRGSSEQKISSTIGQYARGHGTQQKMMLIYM